LAIRAWEIPFEGSLDDLRIYDRVLNDGKRKTLPSNSRWPQYWRRWTAAASRSILSARRRKAGTSRSEKKKGPNPGREGGGVRENRQARLSEYFLDYAAPENERRLYAQLKTLRTQEATWKKPSRRS